MCRSGYFLKRLRHDLRNMKLIGIKDAACFLICKFMKRKILRRVTIVNEALYVRAGTSDLGIVVKWLVDKQYDGIKCSSPSVIVDAGAHIGASAIFFANRYPNANVYAIEPEQENYEILSKNVQKYNNIIPIRAAIWSNNEARTIRDRYTGSWGYTIAPTSQETVSTNQQIDCITIQSILIDQGLNYIDILKMDIEGAEKTVLENSDEWIQKVGIISLELHDRVCFGCSRSFYLATREFKRFEQNGEYIIAYRNGSN